jgi:hypothetical protein
MILVLGTGRSGTSEVAQILHDDLGVHMGHAFHLGDQYNPQGYFEDREVQALHLSYHMMHLDHIDNENMRGLWEERFNQFIDTKEEPWGLKDPGMVDVKGLTDYYLKLNPKIILCTRNREDTIQSFMNMKGISEEKATELVDTRRENNDNVLKDREHLVVECYQTREDKKKLIEEWKTKEKTEGGIT